MDEDLRKNLDLQGMAEVMIFNETENKDVILDIKTIERALQEQNGIPVPITTFVSDGINF
jgi:hypothetical protein